MPKIKKIKNFRTGKIDKIKSCWVDYGADKISLVSNASIEKIGNLKIIDYI
jgi:hypothetical protein